MDKSTFIDVNTMVQRNDTRFLANKLGEEMVMMNLEKGDFIAMNSVGADIWELSAQPVTVKELLAKLQAIYEITPEKCMEETMQFLQTCVGENIFIFNPPAIA